jgi:glycosyltransferase involved in cell wall biosynthesis
MASETIVITSDNSSLKEIMYDKRFLVDAFDENDIYEKIEFVINLSPEERKVIIENNLNYVKSFTWEKSANNLIEIFNTII